jgi:hypothetical protein
MTSATACEREGGRGVRRGRRRDRDLAKAAEAEAIERR